MGLTGVSLRSRQAVARRTTPTSSRACGLFRVRLGAHGVRARQLYPLALTAPPTVASDLRSSACAQTLHPIAGQVSISSCAMLPAWRSTRRGRRNSARVRSRRFLWLERYREWGSRRSTRPFTDGWCALRQAVRVRSRRCERGMLAFDLMPSAKGALSQLPPRRSRRIPTGPRVCSDALRLPIVIVSRHGWCVCGSARCCRSAPLMRIAVLEPHPPLPAECARTCDSRRALLRNASSRRRSHVAGPAHRFALRRHGRLGRGRETARRRRDHSVRASTRADSCYRRERGFQWRVRRRHFVSGSRYCAPNSRA